MLARAARYGVLALGAFLPWALKRRLFQAALGYRLHPSASIGVSLVDCRSVELGPNARIGHACLIQGLDRFSLGTWSVVGNNTRIKAPASDHFWFEGTERDPSCEIGDYVMLTAHHVLDCSDRITIGEWSMLAGGHTLVLTHEIELDSPRPRCAPVTIGERCLLHARVTVRAGTTLPKGTVVAAGAVVTESPAEGYRLYGGVPAKEIKELDPASYFFTQQPRS